MDGHIFTEEKIQGKEADIGNNLRFIGTHLEKYAVTCPIFLVKFDPKGLDIGVFPKEKLQEKPNFEYFISNRCIAQNQRVKNVRLDFLIILINPRWMLNLLCILVH